MSNTRDARRQAVVRWYQHQVRKQDALKRNPTGRQPPVERLPTRPRGDDAGRRSQEEPYGQARSGPALRVA